MAIMIRVQVASSCFLALDWKINELKEKKPIGLVSNGSISVNPG